MSRYCDSPIAGPPEQMGETFKWVALDGKRYKVRRTGGVLVEVRASSRRGPYLRALSLRSPVAKRVRAASEWFQ
uniref:Uncharacterized protein n=1 Tax=Caulobacter phage BL57 TaxID=3348355 RepID=A0AB74UMR4_9VIRU